MNGVTSYTSDSAASNAGYKIKVQVKPTTAASTVVYFDNMQYAMDYIEAQQNATGVTMNASSEVAKVTLLDNITDGVGFQINKGTKNTRVEIDLNEKTYTCKYPLTRENSGVTKAKAIQVLRASSNPTYTSVTIKNGVLNVASAVSGGLIERLIRSYSDLTIDNVTLDGRNVTKQAPDEHGALVCVSAGTLTLKGNTSILTKDDDGSGIYYALTGEPTNNNKYKGGFDLVIDVTGKDRSGNDAVIKNIGWRNGNLNDDHQNTKYASEAATGKTYAYSSKERFTETEATDFHKGKLSISSGKFGEITFDVDSKNFSAQSVFSIGSGVTFDSFDLPSGGSNNGANLLVYQKQIAYDAEYAVGTEGWNKDTTSDYTKTQFKYVAAEKDAEGKSTSNGTVVLNVTGVDDKTDLAFDSKNSLFAVPTQAGATWVDADASKNYGLAELNYSSKGTEVTVSGLTVGSELATAGFSIAQKTSSIAAQAGTGIIAFDVTKIDASDINTNVNIVANGLNNTIYSGGGSNTLTGGAGADVFVYKSGNETITDYNASQNDVVVLASGVEAVTDGEKITTSATDSALVITFDNGSLKFTDNINIGLVTTATRGYAEGDINPGGGVTVQSGKDNYFYNKNGVVKNEEGITLSSEYTPDRYIAEMHGNYQTINAGVVDKALTIEGGVANNYIVAAKKDSSLYGGTGNDTLVGGDGADVFRYTAGKDVIQNLKAADKVDLGDNITFTGVKQASDKLTFSVNNNLSLTFTSLEAETAKVNLTDNGYLTKDGRVSKEESSYTLKLFSGAKGDVDLKNTTLYGEDNIATVDASAATQAINLIAGSKAATYQLASTKKKDTFTYGGAAKTTIEGYEAGIDKINLGENTISAFAVDSKGVTLTLGSGESAKTIQLSGVGKADEVLIHDGDSKSDNSYGKKIFLADNVLADKKTPTSATVMGNDNTFNAATTAPTVKKLFAGSGVTRVTITAGNANNSTVNASVAGTGVNLVGGDKNDKLIGSSDGADVFTYTKGKDVIQNYDPEKDTIAFAAASGVSTLYAIDKATKIAASDKSIKLTFGNSDVLNVKGSGLKSGGIKVGTTNYTFGKNAIISEVEVGSSKQKQATLTSAASGSVKAKNFTDVKYFDGQKVTKNLTFTGSADAEQFFGGQKKTVFKGGGGEDTLTGGYGKDTFFYAKGDKDTVTIADFDFKNDNLKIANGTIKEIVTVSGGGIQFNMTNGAKKNPQDMGSFKVISSATYNAEKVATPNTLTEDTSKDLVIKANSTYYWFETTGEGANALTQLVTTKTKISASDVDTSKFNVIDLTYSTNLLKSNVAKEVATAKTLK